MYFSELQTKRATIQLQELTFLANMEIAKIPANLYEKTLTEFLRYAVKSVKDGSENPLEWTVQERYFIFAHYLACLYGDNGNANFKLNGQGRYFDYLDIESANSMIDKVDVCELDGYKWYATQLTGKMAEAIERLEGLLPFKGYSHWLIGAMAAQLVRENNELPEPATDADYDKWLFDRMMILINYPGFTLASLIYHYEISRKKLNHFFNIDFCQIRNEEQSPSVGNEEQLLGGIGILAKKGADGATLPPARFPVTAALPDKAQRMGKDIFRNGH